MGASDRTTRTWRNAGVVATGRSPHAALRPVPIRAVTLGDGFWRPRLEANRDAGIPSFLKWLERDDQTAPFPAFARHGPDGSHPEIREAMELLDNTFRGHNEHRLLHTWRATVLKLVEACAYVLQSGEHQATRDLLEELVGGIVAAHKNDDFLRAYYGDHFENSYQLATPGHLVQAAIAHHRATGRTEFLECAEGVAQAVLREFEGKEFAEHACIEMALVELYRATGDERYLRGARHFVGLLMEQPPVIGPDAGEGNWRHFNRHVVRQTYLCAGGADYLAETGDATFGEQLDRIWDDMTTGKLHITGQLAVDYWMCERITSEPFGLSTGVFGVLQDHLVRGFELCEAVGNCYWNWRMLAATADAKYADLFERTLYNGFLSHVSLDGAAFHYVSPLATDGDFPPRNAWGSPEANCCPPNALRLMASVPGYFFSTSADGLWVHMYDDCRLDWRLEDGTPLAVVQKTRYPWDGHVAIDVSPGQAATFDVNLRIPGWCGEASVTVNGEPVDAPAPSGGYCRLRREWRESDRIDLTLPMPGVRMETDPRAVDFRGKTALMRGPLVYCFESPDNPDVKVWNIRVRRGPGDLNRTTDARLPGLYAPVGEAAGFEADFHDDLLGGVTALHGPSGVTAVPYYSWANRGPSVMRVWVGVGDSATKGRHE